MTDGEIKIQSAIWELVTTEVDYIHALQTVTDVSLFLEMFAALYIVAWYLLVSVAFVYKRRWSALFNFTHPHTIKS